MAVAAAVAVLSGLAPHGRLPRGRARRHRRRPRRRLDARAAAGDPRRPAPRQLRRGGPVRFDRACGSSPSPRWPGRRLRRAGRRPRAGPRRRRRRRWSPYPLAKPDGLGAGYARSVGSAGAPSPAPRRRRIAAARHRLVGRPARRRRRRAAVAGRVLAVAGDRRDHRRRPRRRSSRSPSARCSSSSPASPPTPRFRVTRGSSAVRAART